MKNRKIKVIIAVFIIMFSFACFHSADAMAGAQADRPDAKSAAEPVSTGAELMEWMENHKNTGGTVKLEGNVTLDGYCSFCPDGRNMPPVFVDMNGYRITVTGDSEFWSDGHLVFLGQEGEQEVFRVATGGRLSLNGLIVEGGQCALWQEEGAGMTLDNCQVSGNVHYADTPFVYDHEPVCVIVERGQTADDVFPSEIEGSINQQGQVSYYQKIPVTWNLEGTKSQQEERKRFSVQGSFSRAASREPALCTVIYNDYPLTFTEVRATANGRMYMFQGWYTKPEEELPITVASEYSFDGSNWSKYEEKTVSDVSDAFFIDILPEQWDTGVNPNIYIRLRWDNDGTYYFSNVLRFAADNLENVEDQGGNRGGGISIVNPPETPKEQLPGTPDKHPPEESKQQSPGFSGGNPPEDPQGSFRDELKETLADDLEGTRPGEPKDALAMETKEAASAETKRNLSKEPKDTLTMETKEAASAESRETPPDESKGNLPKDPKELSAVASGISSIAAENKVALLGLDDRGLPANIGKAGLAALFAVGVAVGFFLYTGHFRKRFHAAKETRLK